MIVVDANVAVKWFLPEAGSDAALDLVSGNDPLFAPTLIRVEVLGAITRRFREGLATRSESLARCQKWLDYLDDGLISLIPEVNLINDAISLSVVIKHAIQDCLYVSAAKQLGATLFTADRPFVDQVQNVYGEVQLLAGCEGH